MSPQPTTVVFRNTWDMYIARTEQGPAFVTFDVDVATAPTLPDLPYCCRVLVRIQNPGPNGAPLQEEGEALDAMEAALVKDLSSNGVLCRMVGRIIHQGIRESVFMVGDLRPFEALVEHWWQRYPERQVRVLTHPGWDFYDAAVRPSQAHWQWIKDRRVVDTLLRRGSDPSKEHTLKFFFLGAAEPLKEVERALVARGYTPSPEDAKEGTLALVLRSRLDTDFIAGESLEHEKLARALGVSYDGWGAYVVK
jgi:regulator of RNase E activity RraB